MAMLNPTRDFQTEFDFDASEYPCCDKCDTNHDVYCMECETHSVSCTCVTLEFYCAACDEDFVWDISEDHKDQMREKRIEDVLEDVDEILDVSITNPNDYCPNCYRAPAHECIDAHTGEIFHWGGPDIQEEIEEVSCKCLPPKYYICAKCNVERDGEDDEWMKRSDKASSLADAFALRELAKGSEEEQPTCYCIPQERYFCGKCRVSRPTPSSMWSPVEGYEQAVKNRKNNKNVQPAKATKTTQVPHSNATSYKSDTSWQDDYAWMGLYKCRHYGELVTLPDGTKIHCSSLWDKRKDDNEQPERGLYFDWSWKPDWRSELALWPDFSVPTNLKATAEAIKEFYLLANHGKKIEIGCIGGHGRTGTALACMAILAGVPAAQAGNWVKTNYCKEAIESQIQWWYIKWFDAYVNDKPLPERPSYQSSSASTTLLSCTMSQHYTQFLANPNSKKCTARKDACKLFTEDIKRFSKGDVPSHVVKGALEIKTTSEFNNIDGYKVPKSKAGEPSHNRNNAYCKCDYCRYRERGMIALLDPVGVKEIYIQTPTAIVKAEVTPDFEPQPPDPWGDYVIGQRIGEYVWLAHDNREMWVWDATKRAKSRYIRENAERNKKKNSATTTKSKPVVSSQKKTVDKDGVKDYRKGNSKANKRNKKNANRSGGRKSRKSKNR